MTAPAWCAEYVGLPHEMGARGPAAYDCWGVVHAALERQFGARVPSLVGADLWDIHDRLARGELLLEETLERVAEPDVGDVLAFDLGHQHVGLVVSSEWMLHALEGRGVVLARWRRQPWTGSRVGCYRPRSLGRA